MSPNLSTPPRILVADDQPDVLEALRLLLSHQGFETTTVSSPDAVIGALDRQPFDVLLMDLNYTRDTTSGREGIDLLSRIHATHESLPVVVMTGWGSVNVAVEAMRLGVRDFVQKPWENTRLVETLAREATEGRSRRLQAREIEEARAIQRRLLPETFPAVTGWTIDGAWLPAPGFGVAGDSFDAIRFDDARVAVTIADVMGKGVPAALLTSNLQAAVRAFAAAAERPGVLCGRVNRILCPNMGGGRFASFFYGRLDADRGRFTYANAGHPAPMLVRADGVVERLGAGGGVLGVDPGWAFDEREVVVGPGDRLVLFTDGVTEATRGDGAEFGEDRLLGLLRAWRSLDATALTARVTGAVRAFAGGAPQDDVTLVVLAADGRSVDIHDLS